MIKNKAFWFQVFRFRTLEEEYRLALGASVKSFVVDSFQEVLSNSKALALRVALTWRVSCRTPTEL